MRAPVALLVVLAAGLVGCGGTGASTRLPTEATASYNGGPYHYAQADREEMLATFRKDGTRIDAKCFLREAEKEMSWEELAKESTQHHLGSRLRSLMVRCGAELKSVSEVAAEEKAEAKTRATREAPIKKLEAAIGEGLGATKAKFEASHDMGEPSQPTPGVAFYKVLGTNSSERVTEYEVRIPAEPPYGDREKLVLLDGTDLPAGSPIVAETSTCIDWRTSALRPLLGTEYAEATTVPEMDTAQMKAVSNPQC